MRVWNGLQSQCGWPLTSRASVMWGELPGCRHKPVQVEELRRAWSSSSICPDHFNPWPLLSCLCWDPLTQGEGGEFLGQGNEGKIPPCCAPTLALPSL